MTSFHWTDTYKNLGNDALKLIEDIKVNPTDEKFKKLNDTIQKFQNGNVGSVKVKLFYIQSFFTKNEEATEKKYLSPCLDKYNIIKVEMPIQLYKKLDSLLRTKSHIELKRNDVLTNMKPIQEDHEGLFNRTETETDIVDFFKNPVNITKDKIYIVSDRVPYLYKMELLD